MKRLMTAAPTSIKALVALWPSHEEMAVDIGAKPHQPRDWARRGRISAKYIDAVVRAARKRGYDRITHELIVRLNAGMPARRAA
jgi:hypothetical protein